MELKKVAVVGAGAIGSYFIYNMQEKLGQDFMVLAEGSRLEKLQKEGVVINGVKTPVNAVSFAEAGTADLLIIATKYGALREAALQSKAVVGENTVVLSVLNGIDSEEVCGEILGMEHIVPSFMLIMAARTEAGTTFNPEITKGLFFGEKDGSLSERVLAIQALMDRTGTHYKMPEDILTAQWNKFTRNIINNLIQAVFSVGYGAYRDSEHVQFIRRKVYDETIAVAKAEGITVATKYDPDKDAPAKARFSTLQDMDAKRATETDMFLGVLLKLGEKHGISLPYCEYTYHALKTLEEKNAGKFDYQD